MQIKGLQEELMKQFIAQREARGLYRSLADILRRM
jgi:hypothetical protein